MNYVVEVQSFGVGGGSAPGATSICGGWVPEDQLGATGVEHRGSVRSQQHHSGPRRYLGRRLILRCQLLQCVHVHADEVPSLLLRWVKFYHILIFTYFTIRTDVSVSQPFIKMDIIGHIYFNNLMSHLSKIIRLKSYLSCKIPIKRQLLQS